jgi:NADPH:quinone reductase-like Zn-dependent oxidoreductase
MRREDSVKAVVFQRAGNPDEVLQIAEIPPPEPRDGQVLVKVNARPIQPADSFFIRGQYRLKPNFVQVAGLEGAGVVIDSGRSSVHSLADFKNALAADADRTRDGKVLIA